jgi:hypothetical protein
MMIETNLNADSPKTTTKKLAQTDAVALLQQGVQPDGENVDAQSPAASAHATMTQRAEKPVHGHRSIEMLFHR